MNRDEDIAWIAYQIWEEEGHPHGRETEHWLKAEAIRQNHMSFTDAFKSKVDVIKAFCDTAKTYIQISSAALALPMVFTQAILGKDIAEKGFRDFGLPWSLILAWISFLLAIGFGLAYQWLAIRMVWGELHRAQRTRWNADSPGFRTTRWVPQFRRFNRSFLYGGMVVFFTWVRFY